MNFEKVINSYENNIGKMHYIIKKGNNQILLTAVHTVYQKHKDKLPEPYTGAIAQYVSEKVNGSYIIKCFDNGTDSNSEEIDDFKKYLIEFIKNNNIKLILDIHGASLERDFDIEFGTLNGLSSDLTTVKSLEDSFIDHGIFNIRHNDVFKGGEITKTIFENINIDIIQLEINKSYRDFNNIKKCEKVCNSLTHFLEYYIEKTK